MWFLPTYKRPALCQAALDACEESGMTSAAMLFIDAPCDGYENIRLPANWSVFRAAYHWDLAGSMNWCLEKFPNEAFYGWIADDMKPRTQGWDKLLEAAAIPLDLATCHDDYLSPNESIRDGILPGAMCWGGDLVRAVGWWAPPGVRQGGIDDTWVRLVKKKFLPDVLVGHDNYRTGRRVKDETDEWVRDGVPYVQNDLTFAQNFWGSEGFREAQARILEARMAHGL